MSNLEQIISEELFLNAFKICKSYCEQEYIQDINLRLLKETVLKLSENRVKKYYQLFIKT